MLDSISRHKMMADKLQIEINNGRLEGEFVEDFIPSVRKRLQDVRELTEKQAKILEDLFERN